MTKKKENYSEKKFINDLWKTMKDQEKANPSLSILHEVVDGTIKLVGLTGGIACGKSLVSQFFLEKKIPVIDADIIARDIVLPKKKAHTSIVKKFGQSILIAQGKDKGMINRASLGEMVFEDPLKRKILEEITHPEIWKEIGKKIQTYKKSGNKLVVLDAALLFESKMDAFMSQVVVVSSNPDIQLERLMKRDNISEDLALKKIQSQMSLRDKAQKASFVIDNSGSIESTRSQFEEVFAYLR